MYWKNNVQFTWWLAGFWLEESQCIFAQWSWLVTRFKFCYVTVLQDAFLYWGQILSLVYKQEIMFADMTIVFFRNICTHIRRSLNGSRRTPATECTGKDSLGNRLVRTSEPDADRVLDASRFDTQEPYAHYECLFGRWETTSCDVPLHEPWEPEAVSQEIALAWRTFQGKKQRVFALHATFRKTSHRLSSYLAFCANIETS